MPRGAFVCWHLSVVSHKEIKHGQALQSPQEQIQGLFLLIGLNCTSYTGSLRPEQIENKEDNTDRWLTRVYSCREFSDFIKFPAVVWAQSNLRCGWVTTGFHLWIEIGLWKLESSPQWSWAHSSWEVELIFSFERSSLSCGIWCGLLWRQDKRPFTLKKKKPKKPKNCWNKIYFRPNLSRIQFEILANFFLAGMGRERVNEITIFFCVWKTRK